MRCCSLREKLARALALLRTYQSRLRAVHPNPNPSVAAAPPPPPPPEALGAAHAPPAGASPALPALRAAPGEVRSVPAGRCPACCQRIAGAPGGRSAEDSAADRVSVDANPVSAPATPDALADLAASLLAWQLRRGGGPTLEGLASAPRGSGSAPEPAAASVSVAPQSLAGGARGGRALRFDSFSGRSGAFVYEHTGGATGSHEPSMSAEAACAPARADASLAGSGAGHHSGGTASWDQSTGQAAGAAAPASGEAGASGDAQGSGAGAAAADRHGNNFGQGARSAIGVAAGGAVLHCAGGVAAGPLADRAPVAAAADAAVAGQHPESGERLLLAADEHAPWRQRAHAAHAHEDPEAADRAEAVRLQPGERAKLNATAR